MSVVRTAASPRRLLQTPTVRALSAAAVIARLPFGMGALALVVFVHARTGSFGAAGVVTGAYTLGFALAGPLLGRSVDRRGPIPVMLPASAVTALALIAVVALGENGAGTLTLVVASAVAGAATPPVSGVLRRTWPAVVKPVDLPAAYLLDSILIEVVFIAGPLLTGLLAAAVSPAAPLLAAAGLGLLGMVVFLAVPAVRGLTRAAREHHTRAGALASPAVRFVAATGIPVGATFGALDVAFPAFGSVHGGTALGGLFGAALAVGSAGGAFVFAAFPERLNELRGSYLRLAAAQPALSAPLLLAPTAWVMAILALLAGSFAAPMLTLRSRAAQVSMPEGTGTEAFTWLLLAVMIGASASSAIAGPLVASWGWRAGVLLAVAIPALCLPAIYAGRRYLPRS